jgi:hypothetical protein
MGSKTNKCQGAEVQRLYKKSKMQGYKKVKVLVIAAILHKIDFSLGYPHRYTSSSGENKREVQVMSYLCLPFLMVVGFWRVTLRLLQNIRPN